jgi:5S rRNA maturation endonuclease (ribonuclease M5)
MAPSEYRSIDDEQARISLQEAAARCGASLTVHGSGRQVRIDCPFGCDGDHAGKREISVDTANPQKVFCCHSYGCQARGNLLALMHGWLTGTPPIGGKLKGEEFKRVRNVLLGSPSPPSRDTPPKPSQEEGRKPLHNPPLSESPNEKARELADLYRKFVTDVAVMPPHAASYVRRHPCLTPQAMEKWNVGVLPLDGGGDKRGWSIRGQFIYPLRGEDGRISGYVARDPGFEAKEQAFEALSPPERAKEKPPMKHRFPVDYRRGLDLYGQHASRLEESGYREWIARNGILVVEGFNDVIGLDSLGIPAVAIMSNRITDEQIAKVERWARQLAGGRVSLLFDADDAGDGGAKEALWLLAQRGLQVRLVWTQAMHDGAFRNRQPESLDRNEVTVLFR